MKILIEVDTKNLETLLEAQALISLYRLGLENPAEKSPEEAVEDAKPKPKKRATGQRIRPAKEEPVAEEPVAEEPVAEEPVAEEPVAEEPVASAVTLTELKKAAKAASDVVGRENVLKAIKRYGGKLADVTENNYQALHNDLTALVK